jgi:cytoskeleton protein RodZ
MSDGVDPVQGDGSDAVNLTQSLTAGRMLRNAREAVGLHVGALAVSMKVPVKKLEALEADRFDLLPDAVFVRALASSVCRTLKIDAAPVLEKLPRSHAPQLGPGSRAVNEPFYAYGKSGALSFPGLFAKPTALWVLVFLAATIAVFFLPELQKFSLNRDEKYAVEDVNPPLAPVGPNYAPEDPAPMPDSNMGGEVGVSLMLTSPSASAPSGAAISADQQPVTGTVVATATGIAAQQAAVSPVSTGANDLAAELLGLKARGPTWVKVVDAKGTVQLMKIMVAGESVRVGGTVPLSVVVGAADSLDVVVRGVPFELQVVAKDNVARFEVK